MKKGKLPLPLVPRQFYSSVQPERKRSPGRWAWHLACEPLGGETGERAPLLLNASLKLNAQSRVEPSMAQVAQGVAGCALVPALRVFFPLVRLHGRELE